MEYNMLYIKKVSKVILFCLPVLTGLNLHAQGPSESSAVVIGLHDYVLEKHTSLNGRLARVKSGLLGVLKGHARDLWWLYNRYDRKGDGKMFLDKDKKDIPIKPATYQLLLAGLERPSIASLIPDLIRIANSYRNINSDEKAIIEYLKEKGHTVYLTTPRGPFAYEQLLDRHGENLTSLSEKVFVSEQEGNDPRVVERLRQALESPGSRDLPSAEFLSVLRAVLTIEPTQNIIHVPNGDIDSNRKFIQESIGTENEIVFIDPSRGKKLAHSLVDMGLLNINEDRSLLDSVGYFGWPGGRIKALVPDRNFKQLFFEI